MIIGRMHDFPKETLLSSCWATSIKAYAKHCSLFGTQDNLTIGQYLEKHIYIYISIIYDICLKEQFFQEFKNVQNRYSSSYGNSTGHEDHENVWIQQSNIGWVTCSNGIKSTQYISVYISLHQFIYISIHFSAIIYTFTYTIHSEYLQCDIRWATSAPQGPFFSAALPIAPACCAQGPTNRSTWRSKDV